MCNCNILGCGCVNPGYMWAPMASPRFGENQELISSEYAKYSEPFMISSIIERLIAKWSCIVEYQYHKRTELHEFVLRVDDLNKRSIVCRTEQLKDVV